MKLVISAIASGVTMFALSYLLFVAAFGKLFSEYYGHIQRPMYDVKIWAVILGYLITAFLLALLYRKFYEGGSAFNSGLKFGLYMGAFASFPYMFYTWAAVRVPYQGVVLDALISFVIIIAGSVVTAFVYSSSLFEKSELKEKTV